MEAVAEEMGVNDLYSIGSKEVAQCTDQMGIELGKRPGYDLDLNSGSLEIRAERTIERAIDEVLEIAIGQGSHQRLQNLLSPSQSKTVNAVGNLHSGTRLLDCSGLR